MGIHVGSEYREATIEDVEPVASFLDKIGTRTAHPKIEVDLYATGHLLEGRVVVSKAQLDLFAAELDALVSSRPELAYLRDSFLESFPAANSGAYLGA